MPSSPLPRTLGCAQSIADSPGMLPPTSRWLDLFAGTGAVGLEAVSRGAREAHFVELDPWVCKQVRAVPPGPGLADGHVWAAGRRPVVCPECSKQQQRLGSQCPSGHPFLRACGAPARLMRRAHRACASSDDVLPPAILLSFPLCMRAGAWPQHHHVQLQQPRGRAHHQG